MSKPIIPALALTCAALTATSFAQEFKPGDEVVALRDRELKIGREPVASVRKGQKLTVEQVQDNWLWVRSGKTRGWVDTRSVISSALLAWYERLPDNESVEAARQVMAKLDGVMFDIHDAGAERQLTHMGEGNIFDGIRRDYLVLARYTKVGISTYRVSARHRALGIKFDPPNIGMVLPPPPGSLGAPYGRIQAGDYVLISARTRQVFVNGQLRRPSR